ncbi:MAG TPA: XRE family transcriptional regulator [Gemmatimonadales bacterium]|nr:XRE family transcriptional regulator [Gemmatimonadales bacterium]
MAKKWKDLIARMPADRQARIAEGTAKLIAEMPLHELRRAQELSQEQLAELLGEKQPSISKMEQRTDMYISTLRRYIEAMGGELDIVARFPVGSVRITQFAENGNRDVA